MEIAVEPGLSDIFEKRYGIDINELEMSQGKNAVTKLGSAMIKDEALCIRCGYCADRCPTEAVTMEHFSYQKNFNWKL
jgi:ferredoxin